MGTLSIIGALPRKSSNSQSQSVNHKERPIPRQRPKTPQRRDARESDNVNGHFLEISDPAQILLLLTSATSKPAEDAMDGKLEEMAEQKVSGDDMFRINGVLQQ